jgi:hypothetical protein
VTEKLVKKLLGKRKMVFFPTSIFFPHGPICIWFPFSDSYGTEVHENDDIYPWLKCSQGCDLYLLSKEMQINNACK